MNRPPHTIRRAAAIALAAVGLAVAAAPQPASANGCLLPPVWDGATSTYTISTADQLRTLWQGACDMSATIRLANDIDLTGTGDFSPIGHGIDPFTGTFDGGGHTISGLQITSSNEQGYGLFGRTNGAVLRDVTVTGSVAVTSSYYAGGLLVGEARATTISNVHASGTVEGWGSVGGVAGLMLQGGSLTVSSADAQVAAIHDGAGVLVGKVGAPGDPATAISQVTTKGSAIADASDAGGITALANSMTLSRASSSASVRAYLAGGLVGGDGGLGAVSIADSYSTGSVSGTAGGTLAVGGIVGAICQVPTSGISRTYFTGTLAPLGASGSGGIVGLVQQCVQQASLTAFAADGSVWNTDTAGPAGGVTAFGAGRTTAQMKDITTYTAAGWSIVNGWEPAGTSTWGICSQVNDGYPFLQGQMVSTACAPLPPTPTAAASGVAALTATVLPSRSRAVSGQTLRIGIRAANTGGTAAEAVTACLWLPVNLVVTSSDGATRSGRTACFAVGTLASGARATRALTVRAVSSRRITRTVTGSVRATGVATAAAAPIALVITPRRAKARVTG